MNSNECYKAYELMTIGMIEKDPNKLRESMSEHAHLVHMTGRVEAREEYIKDILDGTLNYYDYKIEKFQINGDFAEVLINLKAKVYGGATSWWRLKMTVTFVLENGKYKVNESKVRMG